MKLFIRILIFLLVMCIITQCAVIFFVPMELVYKDRIKYRVFKNNPDTIEAVIDKLKQKIDREKITDYVILLGDSVTFSTPVGEEDSLAPLLENLAATDDCKTAFFNLAIPSEYPGDIYTVIKMLHKHCISTDNLIINFNYFEFLFDQHATSIFWFKDQLKDVDINAYDHIYSNKEKRSISQLKNGVAHFLGTNLDILLYKDYFRAGLSSLLVKDYHDFKGDIRPWYDKKNSPEKLKKSSNNWYFSDKNITLDESRSCIFFINKIIDLQKGKHTLIFLQGYNRELLKVELSKEGYNRNLRNIDEYFASKPVEYINFDKQLDYKLYADFVHLTPEGYKVLAQDLWARFRMG